MVGSVLPPPPSGSRRYEASLRKDREKVEAAATEKQKIERERQEALDKEGHRARELVAKKGTLPAEPAAYS